MAEYEKRVRDILSQNGCTFQRRYSPITQRSITVDIRIKSRHTANAIMKQSGINYKF